jgi:DNA-binding response OmpR family regulator
LGKEVKLSRTEFDILLVLAKDLNSELDFKRIATLIGKESEDLEALRNQMKWHLQNLRKNLQEHGSHTTLTYRKNKGYKLSVQMGSENSGDEE